MTLGTAQFERLVGFYQGLLQQVAHPYLPDRYAEFALPGMKLALFRPQVEHQSEFDQPSSGGMSLCLEVVDLEGAIAHLTTLGYPPPGPIISASHGREVYAYDPDGNRLILHQTHSPIP
ncbi:MAG: glyoxalase [Cyanobacteria bacterium Co-bin13]|nr:glyoxalase [Cyanobacteria bacterium Co-bin13]